MFLSRLNEIKGGCEKILPVSGSFSSNFKLFSNDGFYCVVMSMKCEGEWNSIIIFLL